MLSSLLIKLIRNDQEEASSTKYHRFPTSIRYNNDWRSSKSYGVNEINTTKEENGSITIYRIKQYLFDIEKANKALDKIKKGLTIKQVLTDFLFGFVQLGRRRLRSNEEFKKNKFYDSDLMKPYIHCRIACPGSLQQLMRECFVQAKITDKNHVKKQLSFVTEVEAISYYQISLDRRTTRLNIDQNYLLCDIGENSFGIADIRVDTTEATSTVELKNENSKLGSAALDNRFKVYLEERCSGWFDEEESSSIIEKSCSEFSKITKVNLNYTNLIERFF